MRKRKNIFYVISGLFVFLAFLSYFIGNYFLNYALVPGKGGQDRKLKNQNEEVKVEDVNREKLDQDIAIWLDKLKDKTEEVQIKSEDGLDLFGHTYKNEKSNKWVILVHGYQAREDKSLDYAENYYNMGYNILTISQRAHGKSQGKYIGMGYLEKDDLISWTNYLISRDKKIEIVYHGASMGGATVLMAAGLENLPCQVKAIVSDCAYSNLWEIFSLELKKRFGLPSFPILDITDFIVRAKAKYSMHDGDVKEYVKKSKLAILFIHGKDDDFVPYEMGQELYDVKVIGEKKILLIDKAGHRKAHLLDRDRYYSTIEDFLKDKVK